MTQFEDELLLGDTVADKLWSIDQDDPDGSASQDRGVFPIGLGTVTSLVEHGGELLAADDDQLWVVDPDDPDSASTQTRGVPQLEIGGMASTGATLYATVRTHSNVDFICVKSPATGHTSACSTLPAGFIRGGGMTTHGGDLLAVDRSADALWDINETAGGSSVLAWRL